MLSVAGCLTSEEPKLKVEVPVIVPRTAPAELKAQCPRLPPKPVGGFPETVEGLRAMLAWATRGLYAGSACRALSDKQGQWISEPPT